MSLQQHTLAQLLAELSARQPAPGGGTAAAMGGATAAALVQMAAAFGLGRPEADQRRLEAVGARAASLREQLLELAEADLRSYEPVLAATSLPRDSPERRRALPAARSAAAKVPLAIAAAGAEAAELAAEVASSGSPHLVGDATAAVLLAEASTCAAAYLVECNLRDHPEDDRLTEAHEYAQRAAGARAATVVSPGSIGG